MKKILFFIVLFTSTLVVGQSHLYDPEPKSDAIKAIAQHYINHEDEKLVSALKELHTKATWTKSELLYAKTVLQNLPTNGHLITNGVGDTYPILYLQRVENYRADVKLISLYFFQFENYIEQYIKFGIAKSTLAHVNQKLIGELLKTSSFTPIHIANTVPKDLFEPHIANLYAIGLSFRYATSAFKNSVENYQRWNENYKIIQELSKSAEGKKLTANFLPLLMNLYTFYQSENNESGLQKVNESFDLIGTNIQHKNLKKALGL